MDALKRLETAGQPLPVPDLADFTSKFSGWGVWRDPSAEDAGLAYSHQERELGLMLSERRVATKRLLLVALLFSALCLAFVLLAAFVPGGAVIFLGIAGVFMILTLVKFGRWFVNRQLRVRVFRKGFSIRKVEEVRAIPWSDVDQVIEKWQKMRIQGIPIYTHNFRILLRSGEEIALDRRLENVQQVGRQIQSAVTQEKLPKMIGQLERGETLHFGPLSLNRYGLAQSQKKALAWRQIGQLDIDNYGETTLKIHKSDQGKISLPWARVKGAKIPNLDLLLFLSSWFQATARQTPVEAERAPSASGVAPATVDSGDVVYPLRLPKKTAEGGMKTTLMVGFPGKERRIELVVPAGVAAGTRYRFPGVGPEDPDSGRARNLVVEVEVEQGVPFIQRMEEWQIVFGFLLVLGGLLWLSFYSRLDTLTTLVLGIVVGGVGGGLIAVKHRKVGAISGAVGGGISILLQLVYYIWMFRRYGRESFWNYESMLVLLISLLPGVGIYFLLQKRAR